MKTLFKNQTVHGAGRIVAALFLVLFCGIAHASDVPLMYQTETLAKAAPDECFFGIGNISNAYSPTGIVCQACIDAGGKPKVNQAYVWGLARAGDDFWIGTGANVDSLVSGSYFGASTPTIDPSQVAEFGSSAFARANLAPAKFGDWRPPAIIVYNLTNRTQVRLNETLPTNAVALIYKTLGLRSAGASAPFTNHSNGVVFLAGPTLDNKDINMFAFDGATHAFLGAKAFPQYNNIRKWLLYSNVLYTAVTATNAAGAVLRWNANPADPAFPFSFQTVGNIDTGGSELAIHQGRLFVSTWPGVGADGSVDVVNVLTHPAGIFMSPVIPANGLTTDAAAQWSKIWNIQKYEKDTIIASVTGMGALQSFGGYLYFGTMNVPDLNLFAQNSYFGVSADTNQAAIDKVNCRRAISIFRASQFVSGTLASAKVELLYGDAQIPYRSLNTGVWQTGPNAMGVAPLYGASGFGDRHNTYTWTMSTYSNRLFIGTLFSGSGNAVSGTHSGPTTNAGAWLYCFETNNAPARAITQHGLGNYANYGFRTILTYSNSLYLGMANPRNLLTDTNGPALGGWELNRLTKVFEDKDWNNLADDWETNHFGHTGVDPKADPDHDGVSNLSEFIAGTDPNRAADFLSITNIARGTNGSVRLNWPGHAGRSYQLYQAASPAGPWVPSATVTGSNTPAGCTISAAATPATFFKLNAQLTPAFRP